MNVFDKVVQAITRPQRNHYNIDMLGPNCFTINKNNKKALIYRKDYTLNTVHGQTVECSFYQQPFPSKSCVLYLHTNNGSRLEALSYVQSVLAQQINMCVFDFIGSGLSSGQYITLGVRQATTVSHVVNFLVKKHKIQKIYIWGRSMGAVSALIYSSRAHPSVKGLILDSPFMDLWQLIKETANIRTGLPSFCFSSCVSCVDQKLNQSTGNHLGKYNMLQYLQSSRFDQIPALFIVSKQDGLIGAHHGQTLFQKYRCVHKKLLYIEEQHSKKRNSDTLSKIIDFLNEFICQQSQEVMSLSALCSSQHSLLQDSTEEAWSDRYNRSNQGKISLKSILQELKQ